MHQKQEPYYQTWYRLKGGLFFYLFSCGRKRKYTMFDILATPVHGFAHDRCPLHKNEQQMHTNVITD